MSKLSRRDIGNSEEASAKYRFPSQKFFRRKVEIDGREALDHPELQESLQKSGLLIIEGFWDILRFRQLGIASDGILFDADE